MKVSVLVITYNHERYIAQALDSALMQQLDVDYEIVVGDDCSTDATRSILLDYRARYADKLRLILPDRNSGMHANFARTLAACRGEYVALLEGDDYWCRDDKLARQIALLDTRPDLALCFHDVECVFESGCEAVDVTLNRPRRAVSTLHDLLRGNFIHTCSVMFRRGLFGAFPAWYFTLPVGDWPLHILNALHGDIGYVDEVMGAYRVHPGGVWSTRPKSWQLRESIRVLECVADHLPPAARSLAQRVVAGHYFERARHHASAANFGPARDDAARAARMWLLAAVSLLSALARPSARYQPSPG